MINLPKRKVQKIIKDEDIRQVRGRNPRQRIRKRGHILNKVINPARKSEISTLPQGVGKGEERLHLHRKGKIAFPPAESISCSGMLTALAKNFTLAENFHNKECIEILHPQGAQNDMTRFPRPSRERVRERGIRKVAFTLVEILITLGIIGIVAAMTLPTLMNKISECQILFIYTKRLLILYILPNMAVLGGC